MQSTQARAVRRVALACTAAILCLSACSEDGALAPSEPAAAVRGIEGRVSVGGKPVSARISAIDLTHRYDSAAFVCPTDSAGEYVMPLAPGKYLVSALVRFSEPSYRTYYHSAGGPTSREGEADTLTVREDRASDRADFLFGSLRLRLHLPPALVDDYLSLTVTPWTERMSYGGDAFGLTIFVASTPLDTEIGPIPPGNWAIQLTSRQLDARLWLPGTWDPEAAVAVTVPADSVVEREFFLDVPGARLRGSVTGSWQTMDLEHPSVAAFVDESTMVAAKDVEANGSWAMSLSSAHRVRLRVEIEGVARWIGGRSWGEATEFALVPGEETVVPPQVESGLLVHVTGEGGWVQRNPIFTLVDDSGGVIVPDRWRIHVDLFPLANLAPGVYRIHLRPRQPGREAWLPQWFDGAPDPGSATGVVLPARGGTARITIAVETGGEIRGRVLGNRPDGGWGSTSIFVTPADADSIWGCMKVSDDGGAFVVRGLPDGSYKICVARREPQSPCCEQRFIPGENAHLVWYGGASWHSAAEIAIRDHAAAEGIEIEVNR